MSLPDKDATVDIKTGFLTRMWLRWASDTDKVITAVQQSGPTNGRPTKDLYVGRSYFDTTLGQPVYFKSFDPLVWVTADGAPA